MVAISVIGGKASLAKLRSDKYVHRQFQLLFFSQKFASAEQRLTFYMIDMLGAEPLAMGTLRPLLNERAFQDEKVLPYQAAVHSHCRPMPNMFTVQSAFHNLLASMRLSSGASRRNTVRGVKFGNKFRRRDTITRQPLFSKTRMSSLV